MDETNVKNIIDTTHSEVVFAFKQSKITFNTYIIHYFSYKRKNLKKKNRKIFLAFKIFILHNLY